ncbi:glycosyltransferase involved in cell wall biosynthesis [Roseimicrobium gellanilyticum]|uniref:Glycosyltransferase involved in cell wall biosynthesis n=1 Tax=Roseimicrobium gellanilyticum TaxID=748857 RepID=A0A366HUA4_9BACT|nr:glycosyltransferase family 2 protein [Roseimicrobium gellanilyticum]RBP46287.1 glycosyltransferase involved in cell wall biosynthesis [Roseimicrobium gellanilyticum]
MPITVLIPALMPSGQLLSVVSALSADDRVNRIILVNDGSGQKYEEVFEAAAKDHKVVLLRHAANLGKGAALRTGMNHFLCTDTANSVLVTADADGQHLPVDILKVGERAMQTPAELVLGSRGFSGDVPLRSRFGNTLTRSVYQGLMGPCLTDTQTGLRAIPRSLMVSLLHVRINGYDFEMQMLVMAARERMTITQVPIATVYIENNRDSHFNPLLDSIRIYYVFVRHLSVMLLSLLGDFLVFLCATIAGGSLGLAMVLGRAAVFVGHLIAGRILGLHLRSDWGRRLARLALLLGCLGTVAYLAIGFVAHTPDNWERLLPGVHAWTLVKLAITKLFVELMLLAATVAFQRNSASGEHSVLAPAPANGPQKVGSEAASLGGTP